jgi:hypothetical protein
VKAVKIWKTFHFLHLQRKSLALPSPDANECRHNVERVEKHLTLFLGKGNKYQICCNAQNIGRALVAQVEGAERAAQDGNEGSDPFDRLLPFHEDPSDVRKYFIQRGDLIVNYLWGEQFKLIAKKQKNHHPEKSVLMDEERQDVSNVVVVEYVDTKSGKAFVSNAVVNRFVSTRNRKDFV